MNATAPVANEAALDLLELSGEYVPHHPIARALWLDRGDLSTTAAMDALADRAETLSTGCAGWTIAYELKRLSELSELPLDVSIVDEDDACGVAQILLESSSVTLRVDAHLDLDDKIVISVDQSSMTITSIAIEEPDSFDGFYRADRNSILLSELQRLMPAFFEQIRELARA